MPIPNPESAKKKVPVRLHEKIQGSLEPVVRLQYVVELITGPHPLPLP